MCQFIETICLEDGKILHLPWHQQRLNATRQHFFGTVPELNLSEHIHVQEGTIGRIRCRVSYGRELLGVEYVPYQPRAVHSLKLMECNTLDYSYKYADRASLNALFARRGEADDVLLVRCGLLTDTSIANIALWDGQRWYTPAHPLLPGTHRARLLESGLLTERDIPADTLGQYQQICLFNAMLHFGEQVLPCSSIS